MSLRDVELDVATLLQAAGLGSLADGAPTLYAGPYPASAPDALISCRLSSSDKPAKYLAATGLARHVCTVTVLVRGTREPGAYSESGTQARAAWAALYDLHPDEYILVDPEDGGPTYLGEDAEQRPQWSFTVGLEYLSATAPGVVVPLSRAATLRVGGLELTEDARLGGLLVLGALPFAGFPAAADSRGALLFDTDAGVLRVSDGATWLAVADAAALAAHTAATGAHGVAEVVGASEVQTLSNKAHAGRFNVLAVAAGAVALAIPQGTWLKLGSSTTNADVLLFDGNGVAVGPGGGGRLSLGTLVVGTDVVLQGGLLRSSVKQTLTYQATADGSSAAPAGHRFTTSAPLSSGAVLEVAQKVGAGGADVRRWGVDGAGKQLVTVGDSSATPGNATVNAPAGRSAVAAGASSLTVTNPCATAASLVRAWVQQATADAAGSRVVRTSAAAGSLTVHVEPPPAAPLVVAWEVLN